MKTLTLRCKCHNTLQKGFYVMVNFIHSLTRIWRGLRGISQMEPESRLPTTQISKPDFSLLRSELLNLSRDVAAYVSSLPTAGVTRVENDEEYVAMPSDIVGLVRIKTRKYDDIRTCFFDFEEAPDGTCVVSLKVEALPCLRADEIDRNELLTRFHYYYHPERAKTLLRMNVFAYVPLSADQKEEMARAVAYALYPEAFSLRHTANHYIEDSRGGVPETRVQPTDAAPPNMEGSSSEADHRNFTEKAAYYRRQLAQARNAAGQLTGWYEAAKPIEAQIRGALEGRFSVEWSPACHPRIVFEISAGGKKKCFLEIMPMRHERIGLAVEMYTPTVSGRWPGRTDDVCSDVLAQSRQWYDQSLSDRDGANLLWRYTVFDTQDLNPLQVIETWIDWLNNTDRQLPPDVLHQFVHVVENHLAHSGIEHISIPLLTRDLG